MLIFKKWLTLLFVIAFISTMSSVLWTNDIAYKQEDLAHMEYGWPIKFITQDQSRYTPIYFPEDFNVNIPQEAPTKFLYSRLLLNFSIHLVALSVLFLIVKKYSPFK